MNIEDIYDDIGKTALYVNNKVINYDTDCIQMAIYEIFNNIKKIENTGLVITPNNRAIISLIFIALENYIGTLLKCLSELDKTINYEELSTKDIATRVTKLIESLGGDVSRIYKETSIASKIREFATFRNEIFHDRRRIQKYNHTNFKADINEIKIEDSIEALKIFIDVCRVFSKSIDRLNLMPNIIMYKNDTYYFERIDIFYEKLIKEYFIKILHKYKLNTTYNFEILNYYNWENYKYSLHKIKPIIKAQSSNTVQFKSNIETNIGKQIYDNMTNSKLVNSDKFGIPNLFDN